MNQIFGYHQYIHPPEIQNQLQVNPAALNPVVAPVAEPAPVETQITLERERQAQARALEISLRAGMCLEILKGAADLIDNEADEKMRSQNEKMRSQKLDSLNQIAKEPEWGKEIFQAMLVRCTTSKDDKTQCGPEDLEKVAYYILSLKEDFFPQLREKVVDYLLGVDIKKFHLRKILIESSSTNPGVKEQILSNARTSPKPFLSACGVSYDIFPPEVQKIYLGLLTDACRIDNLWSKFDRGFLIKLYYIIAYSPKSKEYSPTPLHCRLFSAVLQLERIHINPTNELQFPMLFNIAVECGAGFKLITENLDGPRPSTIYQLERILSQGIILFTKGLITDQDLLDYLNCLDKNPTFGLNLWDLIEPDERNPFLKEIADQATHRMSQKSWKVTPTSPLAEFVISHMATEVAKMQPDRVAQISPEEANAYVRLMTKCQKPLNQIPTQFLNAFLNLEIASYLNGTTKGEKFFEHLTYLSKMDTEVYKLNLWQSLNPKDRLPFLEKVRDPTYISFISNIIFTEMSQIAQNSPLEFSQIPSEVMNSFFSLMFQTCKLGVLRKEFFESFTVFIKTREHFLLHSDLLQDWGKLASQQIPSPPPVHFLAVLARVPQEVVDKYLVSGFVPPNLVSNVEEQRGSLKNIKDAFWRVANRSAYYTLLKDQADLDLYFKLTVEFDLHKPKREDKRIYNNKYAQDFLFYLGTHPITTNKVDPEEWRVQRRLSSILPHIGDDVCARLPTLVIKALDFQHRTLIERGCEFSKILIAYKEIWSTLTPAAFDQTFNYLIKNDLRFTEKDGRTVDLSVMAIYVCNVAKERGKDPEAIKSILMKIDLASLPLYLRSSVELMPEEIQDIWQKTASEEWLEELHGRREAEQFSVNLAHLKLKSTTEAASVPSVPQKVEYEELLTLFKGINFKDSKSKDYVNPALLEDQGIPITVPEAEARISAFIIKVKDGPTFAPSKVNDPKGHAQYMDLLEKWVKHSILLLRKKAEQAKKEGKAPLDLAMALSNIASAGYHCGGAIFPTAQDIYLSLSGSQVSYENETLQSFVVDKLMERRTNIVQGHCTRLSNGEAHTQARAFRHVEALNIRMWFDYTDPISGHDVSRPLRNAASLNDFLVHCTRQYANPTLIINEMMKHINGYPWHPCTIGESSNSAFRTLTLEPWFNDNMPVEFDNSFIKNRGDEFQKKDKQAIAEIEKPKFENDLFKKSVEEYYATFKDILNGNVKSDSTEMPKKLLEFFIRYKEANSNFSERAVVETAMKEFEYKDKMECNRLRMKKQILNENNGKFEGDVEKAVDLKRVILFDRQYKKALLRSDEYKAAVKREIYHIDEKTGAVILKRKYAIHMLIELNILSRRDLDHPSVEDLSDGQVLTSIGAPLGKTEKERLATRKTKFPLPPGSSANGRAEISMPLPPPPLPPKPELPAYVFSPGPVSNTTNIINHNVSHAANIINDLYENKGNF